MEAKELMIGDYMRNKRTKEIIWIFEIDGDRNVINNEPDGYCSEKNIDIDDIEPIPITPEILEKNGFVKRSDRDDKLGKMEYYQLDDYGFVYHHSNGVWEFRLINEEEHRIFSGYLNKCS